MAIAGGLELRPRVAEVRKPLEGLLYLWVDVIFDLDQMDRKPLSEWTYARVEQRGTAKYTWRVGHTGSAS